MQAHRRKLSEDTQRNSYMSNISNYSGIVSEGVPINRQNVNIVEGDEFHTPLGSPIDPVLDAKKIKTSPLKNILHQLDDELPLNSPPKDITTVSNYDSSIDSNDAEEIFNARIHYEKTKNHNVGIINDKNVIVGNVIYKEENPIVSNKGSISGSTTDHLNSLTSQTTDHSISYINPNPVIVESKEEEITLPGSFVFNNSLETETKKKRFSTDHYQNNVPVKNVTMPGQYTSQAFYTRGNQGTGAYSNSFKAGETFNSNKSIDDPISINVNSSKEIKPTLVSPNSGHSRNSSIHTNDFKSPLSPHEDLIPPRSPNRPSPELFNRNSFSNDEFDYDSANDNSKELSSGFTTPGSETKQFTTYNGASNFEEISINSLDNKTYLNTLRNSDLREEIKIEQNNQTIRTYSETSSKNLNNILRPPVNNNDIQQDLDLTDDEQLTSLINEMRNRNSSQTSPSLINRKSFGYNSSLLTEQYHPPLKENISPESRNVSINNESIVSVREKIEDKSSSLPSPSSKLFKTSDELLAKNIDLSVPFNLNKPAEIKNNTLLGKFSKSSLNYHHKRYKSDSLDDIELDDKKNLSNNNSRKSSVVSSNNESPLLVKKRSNSSARPLPSPPRSVSNTLPARKVSNTSTIKDELDTPPVIKEHKKQGSIQDLTAEVEKQLLEQKTLDEKKLNESKRSSKQSSRRSSVKPFDYKSISRMIEATSGTEIGQEFKDLNLPMDEKRLLERIVDALSKLTADMISEPERYNEGIRRLGTALRILEGFE